MKAVTHGHQLLAFGISFSILVLACCGGISILDQQTNGQIIVYTLASISIAAAPLFDLQTSLLVFVPVHIVFMILLPRFQPNQEIVSANQINSTAFLCIALGISCMRFKKQVEDFVKEKIIRKKTEALEEANDKLDKFAHVDVITGSANRFCFEEELQSWVEQALKNELYRACSII